MAPRVHLGPGDCTGGRGKGGVDSYSFLVTITTLITINDNISSPSASASLFKDLTVEGGEFDFS